MTNAWSINQLTLSPFFIMFVHFIVDFFTSVFVYDPESIHFLNPSPYTIIDHSQTSAA